MNSGWFFGIACVLTASFCWALSTVWYKQLTSRFSNVALNFHKGWITLVGLTLAWPFVAEAGIEIVSKHTALLLLSGAIGIGIGDTALFAALKRLNEKQTLLIAESVAPILVVIGGIVFLGEWLTLWQLVAIAIIILSVDLVIGLRGHFKGKNREVLSGTALALIAALCQAGGILITRSVLDDGDIHPIASTALRTIGATVFLLLWIRLDIRRLKPHAGVVVDRTLIKPLLLASIIGTLFALSLVQTSLGYVNAAVVQTLIATSAIFSTLIAMFRGEKMDRKVWLGVILAWLGVAIMITVSGGSH